MSFEFDMMKMPAKFYKQRRASEKIFVIQELLNIENHLRADGDTFTSKEEEYFNRMWSIVIRRVEESNEPKLVVYLKSRKTVGAPAQSMDVSMDIKLFTRSYYRPSAHLNARFNDDQLEELHGTQLCTWKALKLTDEEEKKVGKPKLIPDTELKRLKLRNHIGKPQFVVHCPHAVRIKVRVNKTAFLYGDFMRGTNTPNETKFVVGDTSFYISKKHFDQLPEAIQNAQQPGSRLGKSFEKDVDPFDFQQLLSATSPGSPTPIDDNNVEGVLVASSTLHATEVVSRCKTFVEKESSKSLEKKFQLALQFGWEELKEKCLLMFGSAEQMYDAIPSYLQTLTASKTQEQWEEIVKSNNMKTAGKVEDSDDDEEDEENDEPDDQMDQEEDQEENDRMDEGQPKKVHYVRLVEYSDSDSD